MKLENSLEVRGKKIEPSKKIKDHQKKTDERSETNIEDIIDNFSGIPKM